MSDSTSKIFLPGTEFDASSGGAPSTLGPLTALHGLVDVQSIGGASVAGARGATANAEPAGFDAEPDDIIEIQLENGLRIWQTVESAQADYSTSSRSPDEQALLVPKALPLRDPRLSSNRGVQDYAVRGVSLLRGFFTDKAVEKAGEKAALLLARKIESTLDLGLHRCTRPSDPSAKTFDLTPIQSKDIPTDKPVLVLLHGTFSSTSGSFSALLEDSDTGQGKRLWDRIEEAFPGGIVALEHRSVTESPIENAIELVKSLPKGAQISMMSHSRGGLIAELVARASRTDFDKDGAFDSVDYDILRKTGEHEQHRKDLIELKGWLTRRDLNVDQVVRVAGPVGGTTLASNRLDRFFSIILNTFDLIPALRASVAYDMFQSFMVGLIKSKANADELPGLEAMRPLGPIVRLLNRADVELGSRLTMIAGDNEGTGVLRKLAEMAADFFFEDENDFVVNYRSMLRGMPRSLPETKARIDSENITHFTYFSNPDARMNIMAALMPGSDMMLAATPRSTPEFPPDFPELAARGDTSQPVCFVLPGVMGSHIYQNDKWVWVNPIRLALGGVKRLRVDAPDVEPGPMLNMFYGDLARHIGRSHKVIPFAYDWRASILDTANILAAKVEKELEVPNRPIRFMAHSMGGLVVRAFQHLRPDLWARIKARKGSRFVMLGTPNGGAFSMMDNMLGRTKQMKLMEGADPFHDMEDMLSIITALPGLAQLLPTDDNGAYVKQAFWKQLHSHDGDDWVVPPKEAFEAAREGHKLLREHKLDPDTTCYVAGLGDAATPSLVRLVPNGSGGKEIEVRGTPKGDGTVTWATGIPDGIKTWYMRAVHGDLARTKSAFPALLELLDTGSTNALPQTPPALARGLDQDDVVITQPEIQTYPDTDELEAAIMGASANRQEAPAAPQANLHVSIAHGDLRFANYPIAVGHYLDDPISGAEAALDNCLGKHLTKVRDLGLYPGGVGTCEVILRKQRCPEGAIVIGLGKFGDLTPGTLRSSFKQGALRYVMMLRRRAEEQGVKLSDMEQIGLSALVIGNRGATMSVQQSVEAILEAVVDANKILEDTPIAKLQFVELFDDTAFSAADALERIGRNGRVKNNFTHATQINTIMGARLRAGFGASTDTWQRMRVTQPIGPDGDKQTKLNFEAINDGAKAEFKISAVQPAVMAELLDRSDNDTATDRELGRLLFELLIPTELKTFAKDDQKLLLIVDEHTASYPWELLEDDFTVFETEGAGGPQLEEIKPLVVRTPVIRQLVTSGIPTARATSETALVIGDPKSNLPALPGAQAEADLVAQLAHDELGYKVTKLNPPVDGIEALRTIIRQPTKILHLAGHGDLGSEKTGALPGMILGGGLKLTSFEIGQMRYVPELVFLNCCHLGHVQQDVGQIASNLAQQFIKKGARAVIAAGWAVDDAAAQRFAREFYGSMKNGNTFGDAVHHARIEVYAHHGDTNTWGAYQCYGDQDYRMEATSSGGSSSRRETRYFSPQHATKAAINVANDAATSNSGRERLLAQLDRIEDHAEASWHHHADWLEAMGRAYAMLDVFDRAIDLLESAASQPSATASLGVLELIQNLKVRQALDEWDRATGKRVQSAAKHVAQSTQDALSLFTTLDQLTAKPEQGVLLTAERESLKGAALKRRALVETGKTRAAYLDQMIASYESAMNIVEQSQPGRLDPYATFNWLSGHVAAGSLTAGGLSLDVWFARLVQQSKADEKKRPDFWNVVLEAEIDILRPLCGPLKDPIKDVNTNALFEAVKTNVSFAWERGGSYRQARSLREQMHFLKLVMTDAHRDKTDWITRVEAYLHELTWEYRDN
ncbi:MAG: CHAT domain-containing protein [Aliishimia sp.]